MNLKFTIITAFLLTLFTANAQTAKDSTPIPFKLPAKHLSVIDSELQNQSNPLLNLDNTNLFNQSEIEITQTAEENKDFADKLTSFAAKFLGTRYVLGATGPSAFDCSGFVGYVFNNFGIKLSRTSRSQYNEGVRVKNGDLRPGDLMFFQGRAANGTIGHVALVVDVNSDGSCTFIHASTKKGISYQKFPDGGYYSKRFVGAKRILGVTPKAPKA